MIILDGINYNRIDVGLGHNAGSKARSDVETIAGAKTVYCIDREGSKVSKLLQVLSVNARISGKRVLLQFPLKMNDFYIGLIRIPKGSAALIHDVNGLREQDARKAAREVAFLNRFGTVISHNARMTRWLTENGCTARIVELGLFDYLTDVPFCRPDEVTLSDPLTVAFAGNLEKSAFLPKLIEIPGVEWRLFGAKDPNLMNPAAVYLGKFLPDTPPRALSECGFGLVWDGDGIDGCTGPNGAYLGFNNPHKCSLYLAMGLPVIVWSQSALASWVLERGVGVAADSLRELETLRARVTPEAYRRMRENAQRAAAELRAGAFTKAALRAAGLPVEGGNAP